MSILKVLVTGATGRQGGAVARRLYEKGHAVKALVRDPTTPAAKELDNLGISLARGQFDDPKSIEDACRGMDAVFAMTTPYEGGVDAELRQGRNLIDAAKAARVQHFVYTSVASANRKTGISFFDSKQKVEEHLRASGLPHTIIAPVFFMDNFTSPWLGMLRQLQVGELTLALPAGRALQMIAVYDIGAMAAHVIENRNQWLGQRVDIAGDELSGEEAARVLSEASMRPIRYVQVPLERIREASKDVAVMFEWFDRIGYSVNVPALSKRVPKVHWCTLLEWAGAQDWKSILRPADYRKAG
jgi:uncharacterized protein YbjT (DUF2867 family)